MADFGRHGAGARGPPGGGSGAPAWGEFRTTFHFERNTHERVIDMKKMGLSLFAVLLFIGMAALARTAMAAVALIPSTGTVVVVSPDEGAKYICTHCKIGSDTAGKCPICKEEMKKAGAFVCPTCDTTSDKAGKCPCGKDYVKISMAGTKCPGCGYYVSKEAKGCPVCKAAQEKKD